MNLYLVRKSYKFLSKTDHFNTSTLLDQFQKQLAMRKTINSLNDNGNMKQLLNKIPQNLKNIFKI